MSFPTSRSEALEYVPRLRADLLVERFGNEAVVWSPTHRSPLYVDAVATLLLDVVDGSASVAELVDDVVTAVGVEEETATDQIMRVVSLYRSGDLLAGEPHLQVLTHPEFAFDPPDF